MRQPVTLNDLARHLRVHPTTISMALRGHQRISETTRRRVKSLAQRWRYTPNHVARSLRSRSTETLGVAFPFASLPYYAMLLDALDAEADRRSLHLEVHFHQWSPRQEAAIIRTFLERRVDGLIVLATEMSPYPNLAESLSSHPALPCVLVDYPDPERLPSFARGYVATDMKKGSEMLGRHLLEMGHRQIALVTPSLPTPTLSLNHRILGLRSAIARCPTADLTVITLDANSPDVAVTEPGVTAEHHFEQAKEVAEKVFRLAPLPTALVATNETLANILIAFARRRGLRVPEDLSVACYDGTFLSTYGPIPLTSVKQPVDEMARHAVDLILSPRPGGMRNRAEMRIVEPVLILGESVGRVSAIQR